MNGDGETATARGGDLGAVVLLAYGPGFHTHAALRRARALGPDAPVLVVAALPAAREAVDLVAAAPPDHVVAVPGRGTAALVDALSRCAGSVLLLHDDVELSDGAVDLLLAAHGATGTAVVPVLDDPGCDHRPADVAGPGPTPSRRVRPVCLVAGADDLMALARRSLVDPRVRIDDVDWGFSAVPGAVATHVGRCAGRLSRPEGPDGRPLLVANLIVRDEEAVLADALASLDGLVDRIVVCDTGSVDGTVALAEAAGCEVLHRTWRDDFAWARNEALAASGDAWYVIAVDADDRVRCDDPETFRRQLATFVDELDAYRIVVRSPLGLTRPDLVGSETASVRVFRADRTTWRGRIHELAGPVDPAAGHVVAATDGLWIEHVGYATELASLPAKAARNVAIARAVHEDEGSGKSALEYARALMLAGGDARTQLDLLGHVMERSRGTDPASRAYVLATTAGVHLALGEHTQARTLAREALDLVTADDVAARVHAEACEALGADDDLLAGAALAHTSSLRPSFTSPHDRALARARAAGALARAGRFVEAWAEVVTVVAVEPAWFDRWGALVDAAVAHGTPEAAELVVGCLVADASGAALTTLVDRCTPTTVAELCAGATLAAGEAALAPDVVVTGILAALVAGRDDVLAALCDGAWRVDPGRRARVAERADARGRPAVAAALRG